MEKTKNGISFEPITDGLGFHPFENGLPYTPTVKKPAAPVSNPRPSPMGSGAITAGPPTFAREIPAVTDRPIAAPAPSRPVVHSAPRPAPAQPAPLLAEPELGFGYLVKRSLAYTLDTVLNAALCVGGLAVTFWKQDLTPELLSNPGLLVMAFVFLCVFSWALVTAQEVAFGTSVGKKIFGLALRGSAGAIFMRAFLFVPSAAMCGLGLLWAAVDPQKRCWHDAALNLQPIEIARL